eukprot:446546_1
MIGGMKVGWDHPQRLVTPSFLQRSMHLRHPTEHQRDRERWTLLAEVVKSNSGDNEIDEKERGHLYGYSDPSHERSILQKITAERVAYVETAKLRTTAQDLRSKAKHLDFSLGGPLNLFERIKMEEPSIAVAAEFKRASPSKGDINLDLGTDQAVSYTEAGASVLSVLTEEKWFKGSLDDMLSFRRASQEIASSLGVTRPAILRKDFVVDEYMVLEARAYGADTVLLIVAILEVSQLARLIEFCRSEGMEPLVEVHTNREMEIALDTGAHIIGINNRNLHTFELDLTTSEKVSRVATAKGVTWGKNGEIKLCSLSGIKSRLDVIPFENQGFSMVLVGEHLMRASNPANAIQSLLGKGEEDTQESDVSWKRPATKVCGITTVKDAEAALQAGANFIGVIFTQKSKRCVSVTQAKEIVQTVRAFGERKGDNKPLSIAGPSGGLKSVATWFGGWAKALLNASKHTPLVIGVFQDQSIEEVRSIATETGVDLVQLHGNEGWKACAECGVPAIKAVHAPAHSSKKSGSSDYSTPEWTPPPAGLAAAILIDSAVDGTLGGTGELFDPSVARKYSDSGIPVIVAGGISPENVAQVLETTHAWAVDASSKLEVSPGQKDYTLITQYIDAAQRGKRT